MVNIFSTTKGITALTVASAVSKGLLSYDAKVADYWPDFAQAGKGKVTVRQLLAHQAGLSAVTPAPRLRDVADPARLAPMLAAQAPAWQPGTRHGYHAITLGWYQSELIRRTDPAGRTLGRFLAEEIATPLGLDLRFGLPDHIAIPHRVNPWAGDYNRDDVRVVEMPSANGIGTARSVVQLYGVAATGGFELGLAASTLDALAAPPISPSDGTRDRILNVDSAFSLGFCKLLPNFCLGSSRKAFGTPGFGGSFGFADPDTGVGFAYVMNRLGFQLYSDPRELALRQTVFHKVLGERSQT